MSVLFFATSAAYVNYRFRHDRNLWKLAGFLLLNSVASKGYASLVGIRSSTAATYENYQRELEHAQKLGKKLPLK